MVKNYYLFRHGGTQASKTNSDYGSEIFSAHILPESIEPIKKIGEYLKDIHSDFNVSSEFLRCRETAQIVSDITGKQFSFDQRLNEFYQEEFNHLETRLRDFLKEINSRDYQTVLICSHGGVISGLKHLILEDNFEPRDLMDYPQTGILLVIKDKKLEQIDFN